MSENGGNYYIKTPDESDRYYSQLNHIETQKIEKEIYSDEVKSYREIKKENKQRLAAKKHKINRNKVDEERRERAKLLKLTSEELLIKILNDKIKPIYYYEEAIRQNSQEIHKNVHLLNLADEIIKKNERRTDKVAKRIFRLLKK